MCDSVRIASDLLIRLYANMSIMEHEACPEGGNPHPTSDSLIFCNSFFRNLSLSLLDSLLSTKLVLLNVHMHCCFGPGGGADPTPT